LLLFVQGGWHLLDESLVFLRVKVDVGNEKNFDVSLAMMMMMMIMMRYFWIGRCSDDIGTPFCQFGISSSIRMSSTSR